jgi:hypothetical protein
MKEPYREIPVESVDQLQDELTRLRRRPEALLYRGQAEDWPLIPSRYRDLQKKSRLTAKDIDSALHVERGDVSYFAVQADRMGFALPNNVFPLLNPRLCKGTLGTHWAAVTTNPWIETIALAQHHGVPTRLMDFTELPEVALFFAARDVCAKLAALRTSPDAEDDRKFVLWFVDSKYYLQSERVYRVDVTSSSNPYLRAQRAAFLASDTPSLDDLGREITVADIDFSRIIQQDNVSLVEKYVGLRDYWPVLVKFAIPYRFAAELMRRLDAAGFNLMSVMPNPDNVVRHRTERYEQLPPLLSSFERESFDMDRYKMASSLFCVGKPGCSGGQSQVELAKKQIDYGDHVLGIAVAARTALGRLYESIDGLQDAIADL